MSISLFRPGSDGGTKVTLGLVLKLSGEVKNKIKSEVGAGPSDQIDLLEALQEIIPDAVTANAENDPDSPFKGAVAEGTFSFFLMLCKALHEP